VAAAGTVEIAWWWLGSNFWPCGSISKSRFFSKAEASPATGA